VEEKAARERRWPPPSYAGPRNVKVLTLHDPTTIWLWDYLYFFFDTLSTWPVGTYLFSGTLLFEFVPLFAPTCDALPPWDLTADVVDPGLVQSGVYTHRIGGANSSTADKKTSRKLDLSSKCLH